METCQSATVNLDILRLIILGNPAKMPTDLFLWAYHFQSLIQTYISK